MKTSTVMSFLAAFLAAPSLATIAVSYKTFRNLCYMKTNLSFLNLQAGTAYYDDHADNAI
jgi:hypothetical protein